MCEVDILSQGSVLRGAQMSQLWNSLSRRWFACRNPVAERHCKPQRTWGLWAFESSRQAIGGNLYLLSEHVQRRKATCALNEKKHESYRGGILPDARSAGAKDPRERNAAIKSRNAAFTGKRIISLRRGAAQPGMSGVTKNIGAVCSLTFRWLTLLTQN